MSAIVKVSDGCERLIDLLPELQKKKKKAADDGNKNQLAVACKNLGDYYTQEGDYKKALAEYKQEADIYDQLKNKLKHAIANRWIGESYLGLEKFDESLLHIETYLSKYQMLFINPL